MEFEVRLDYTKEDLEAFWRTICHKKPGQGSPKTATPGAHVLTGALLVLYSAAFLWVWWKRFLLFRGAAGDILSLAVCVFCVLMMALGALILLSGVMNWEKFWVERAWKNSQRDKKNITVRFLPEELRVCGPDSTHSFRYAAVRGLWADGERLYLTLDEKAWYILSRRNFTMGAPAELAAFLAGKTGKPVLPVN